MPEAAIDAKKHSDASVTNTGHTIGPHIYILVIASVCIITGFIWDISWHMSIGRDRFLTPPHDFIYIGAITCACVSGFLVLKRSFFGTPEDKASSIKFWGIFYGPLGGLFCIWGAFAMLTSAPFDNWWHNTYGLDTKILSPPHTLLLTGMITIQFGAYVSVVAAGAGKLFDAATAKKHFWLCAIAAGSLLSTIFTLFTEYLEPGLMHSAQFYIAASLLFPVYLFMVSAASRLKWAATATAGVYVFVLAAMVWILQLFPAKPLLGPVLNYFDHFQPFRFPLLLVLPAIPIDLMLHRSWNKKIALKITLAALSFLLVLFVVQWNFGAFYHTSVHSRNWFFASNSLNYAASPHAKYRYAFKPEDVSTGFALVKGLVVAAICAITSGFLGYAWGGWIKRIQR